MLRGGLWCSVSLSSLDVLLHHNRSVPLLPSPPLRQLGTRRRPGEVPCARPTEKAGATQGCAVSIHRSSGGREEWTRDETRQRRPTAQKAITETDTVLTH